MRKYRLLIFQLIFLVVDAASTEYDDFYYIIRIILEDIISSDLIRMNSKIHIR